ncbi:Hypothetical_protein [Hexamita inflata]|uniref:Hypothetical_protein n=1 Tax=Hexamita inflata TaxID=28002 RepID=A0AA86PNU0_9EUKA|nr:Hypothetical protein HINF_LOCUS31084 [Hexamita inflata]
MFFYTTALIEANIFYLSTMHASNLTNIFTPLILSRQTARIRAEPCGCDYPAQYGINSYTKSLKPQYAAAYNGVHEEVYISTAWYIKQLKAATLCVTTACSKGDLFQLSFISF